MIIHILKPNAQWKRSRLRLPVELSWVVFRRALGLFKGAFTHPPLQLRAIRRCLVAALRVKGSLSCSDICDSFARTDYNLYACVISLEKSCQSSRNYDNRSVRLPRSQCRIVWSRGRIKSVKLSWQWQLCAVDAIVHVHLCQLTYHKLHTEIYRLYKTCAPLNPLDCKVNYSATSHNIMSVHWPLVQRGGDW